MSFDMQQLSINLQAIFDELNEFKSIQEASFQSVEVSYCENLQEIQDLQKKVNAALNALKKITLKKLEEIKTTLQTSLKKDIDNCSRLEDELKQLSETVNALCDKSRNDIEFIARRKCLDKIQESKTYLKKKPVKVQSSILFKGIFSRFGKLTKLKKVVSDSQIFFLVMIFVRKQ
ncbi:hypothetical protein DPMN_091551 [Dreissena polymorpha]|uniref:Uncharacterized protein n=1 Tax=Dreissena polymorpha TaxID=45954 RepID=A0A9D4KZQ5_DREPO|nr:hypothetical protein DPMN_091551 [Dreissena polymorpha]